MSSLLKMSDSEMAAVEAAEGFGVMPAIGLSATASVLALGGMVMRYSVGDEVPLPGMDHLLGQIVWAGVLAGTMLMAAALIRGVFMKRLQWAVLISLLVHLCVCLTLNTLVVESPLMAMETGASDVPMQEFSIPDYGGAEAKDSPSQQWEQPTDVDIPETEQQQMKRRENELEMQAEPEQFDAQRQVDEALTPERRQLEQQMQQERELEIQKQMQTAESQMPQQIDAPEFETQEVQELNLQAQKMDRSDAQLESQQRQQYEVERQSDPRVSANEIANRAEVTPQEVMRLEMLRQRREVAEARISEAMAQSVDVAAASRATEMSARLREIQQARQSQPDMPRRSQNNDNQPSSSQMQVRNSSISRSDSSEAMNTEFTPSSGGSASMRRSSSAASQNASAASSSAQSVNVATAGGVTSPTYSANASASNVARGRASIPSGAAGGGGGAPSMRLSNAGVSALQSGSIGRSQGTSSGPQMGNAVASNSGRSSGAMSNGSRSNQGQAMNAAGATAGNVSVATASGGGGSTEQVLAGGPSSSASNVGRSGGGLPSSSGTNGSTGFRPSGSRSVGSMSNGQSLAGGARGRQGLTGRATGASAELGGRVGSTVGSLGAAGSTSGASRRSAAVSVPEGVLRAEQNGALVIAGPQAAPRASGSAGRLSGPRAGSVARRSPGLPGVGRGPSMSRPSRTRPSLSGLGTAGLAPRRSTAGTGRPKISSSREVASMIRRSVPGISPIPTERLSATFSMRTPEGRAEAVSKLGGSEASEAAVARGLEWLANHQFAAGNWSIHEFNCKDHQCLGGGSYQADTAATGLALLAFLGAGHTHQSGEYQQVVKRGLIWLVERQGSDGDLFRTDTEFCWLYSHGMATIALCEAYGMTKDSRLKQPAQKAIDFIVASQHPTFGGWRYRPRFESDTSVSGWQMMALKSGEIAGLQIPAKTYSGVGDWLDTVEQADAPGRFSYHPYKKSTPTMSAEGLLMRQYLGADRNDQAVVAGASYLKQRLPKSDARDVYYWYYATQVMFHMQGSHWDEWNGALRNMLVDGQEKSGPEKGSWDPAIPHKDTWGQSGGRHYVTCLNLLMLEVYYRHLPLYLELQQ